MPRRGPKPKPNVSRYPGGQIKHADRERPDDVASWPRIKAEAKKAAQNPILGTELGRLAYHEKISAFELDAGREWNRIVYSHRRWVLGAPKSNPGVVSFERGLGAGQDTDIDTRQIEDDYDSAFVRVIELKDGVYVMRALNDLCIGDEVLDYQRLMQAREGLKVLAKHFGFVKRAS